MKRSKINLHKLYDNDWHREIQVKWKAKQKIINNIFRNNNLTDIEKSEILDMYAGWIYGYYGGNPDYGENLIAQLEKKHILNKKLRVYYKLGKRRK